MLAWGKTGPVRAGATAGLAGRRAADIYRRCAVGLYKQALLTLGDSALAGDVACGVTAGECTPPPAPGFDQDEARYRLAEPVFRRYRQLAGGIDPGGLDPGGLDPGGLLSEDRRKRSGSRYPAASGTSGPAELWVHIRATWRPSCTRYCAGWPPHRPPVPRAARSGTRDIDVGPALADPLKRGENNAGTGVRHGHHRGRGRNGVWAGAGGQRAAGCAAVHENEENVTRARAISISRSG